MFGEKTPDTPMVVEDTTNSVESPMDNQETTTVKKSGIIIEPLSVPEVLIVVFIGIALIISVIHEDNNTATMLGAGLTGYLGSTIKTNIGKQGITTTTTTNTPK